MPQLRVMPGAPDANVYGDVFGGWIMAQVDIAGSLPATRRANGRVATIAVNSFLFKQPVFVGDLLSFYADIVKVGNTSITVYVEVYAERNRLQADIVKVTEATLTYVATGADRKPRVLPPLESLINSPHHAMNPQRRILLLNAAQLAAAGALGGAGVACAARVPDAAYPFSLGVASGSPLPDSVILWTRILADPLNAAATSPVALSVRWEVAEDEAFRRIAAKGSATALPALAHSVHVDVKGLQPGRWYWYRFMLGEAVSPVGRTRTAPAPGEMPALLKLAVASCQHWEFGSYAAHRHIAAAAPDLVAFVGDYIYEWGPYRLSHPLKPRAQRRVAHACPVPRPLRPVQERPRPAGGAPGRALDRHLGRSRSGQRLHQRRRSPRLARLSRAARRGLPGLL